MEMSEGVTHARVKFAYSGIIEVATIDRLPDFVSGQEKLVKKEKFYRVKTAKGTYEPAQVDSLIGMFKIDYILK